MFISRPILSPCVNDIYLKRSSGKFQLVHNFPHIAVARVFIIGKHSHHKVKHTSSIHHKPALNAASAVSSFFPIKWFGDKIVYIYICDKPLRSLLLK